MGALRIMTFNVQMLPWIADAKAGTTNDAPVRADRVAAAIFDLPPGEQPDVIAFNEVFDEDGRDRLLGRLSGKWSHIVKKIHDGGLLEDSGLMLFSRIPLLPLKTGGVWLERFYSDAEGDDAKSSKGVGVVQVASPDGVGAPTTIAFTHLQASYEAEDQYRDVRHRQLDMVCGAVRELIGDDPHLWERVIVMGDLNIRGDSGAVTDEWAQTFALQSTELTTRVYDGWRTCMHPPFDPSDYDPGWTNTEWQSGRQQRLDYMLFGNPKERALVPHHMMSRIRNASDHFSLEAVVQRKSDHCQPQTAVELRNVAPVAGDTVGQPTSLRIVHLALDHPGSFQWLYSDRPGTFTFWGGSDLEVRCFAQSDLSSPLGMLDTLTISDLDPNLQAPFVEAAVDPRGSTHVAAEPFYVAVRSRKNKTGARELLVLEHHGESCATAIGLAPSTPTRTGFPVGQRLGSEDRCWFKALLPATFAGDPRDEVFAVHNPGLVSCTIALRDSAQQPLLHAAGASEEVAVSYTTVGGERVFAVLQRESLGDVDFTVTWRSPVSYLMLDRPLGLFINDETSVDSPGADEVYLDIWLDSQPAFNGYWDDADTGETWPGLAADIAQRVRARIPTAGNRVAFSESVSLSYVEEDFAAKGWQAVTIVGPASGELDVVDRRPTLPVPDPVSDGMYTFYCWLTRLG